MSKMMHNTHSAAVPASRDRRNFLIAGAGLTLAATPLGRSGAVMAKPAGQDTPNRCGACQNPIAGRSRRSVYRKSVG